MKKHFILVLLALSLSVVHAEVSPSHAAVIEKMFTVMKLDKQYEASLVAGFESGLGVSSEQIKSLPQEQQDKFDKAIAKVKARLMELMGWDKMKDKMIQVYADMFSEQEAAQIITLMDSPTGQMLVSKQVALIKEALKLTQGMMKDIYPQIMEIMQEEMTK